MDFLNFGPEDSAPNGNSSNWADSCLAEKNNKSVGGNITELPLSVQPFREPLELFSPYMSEYQVTEIDDELILTPLISPDLTPSPTGTLSLSDEISGALENAKLISPSMSPLNNSQVNVQQETSKNCHKRFSNGLSHIDSPRFNENYNGTLPSEAISIANSLNFLASKMNGYPTRATNDLSRLTPASVLNLNPAMECLATQNMNILNSFDVVNSAKTDDEMIRKKEEVDVRRSNHKIAEQRRRDSIKKCFQDLRLVLPNLTEKNPSKLYILQKTFEYVTNLQHDHINALKELEEAKKELVRLKDRSNI